MSKIISSMLYSFLGAIPRCMNFMCQRLGTLFLFQLHRSCSYLFRNVGKYKSEAGKSPKSKNIKKYYLPSTIYQKECAWAKLVSPRQVQIG